MKPKIIYDSDEELIVRYRHGPEALLYEVRVTIKDGGKTPVSAQLRLDDIPTFAAPMPPEEHRIEAKGVLDLCAKLAKFFAKHGYGI